MSDLQFRAFSVSPDQARAILATDNPVPMFDFERGEFVPEVLAADGMRVRGGAKQVPMLDTHSKASLDDVLGSVRDISVQRYDIQGTPVFDEGDRGAAAKRKVEGGHITDLSVGYTVSRAHTKYAAAGSVVEHDGKTYEGPVNVRTQWEMYEVSLVPVGADAAAKMRGYLSLADAREKLGQLQREKATESQSAESGTTGELSGVASSGEGSPVAGETKTRTAKGETKRAKSKPILKMDSELNEAELAVQRERAQADARKDEVRRMDCIRDLGRQLGEKQGDPDFGNKWARDQIDKGTELAVARQAFDVIKDFKRQPLDQDAERAERTLDVPKKDIEKYSLTKAIVELAERGHVSGLEGELSQEIAGRISKKPNGFFLPSYDLPMQREQRNSPYDADTNDTTLVGTDHRPDMFIDILRNRMVATQLGVRMIGGLVGNVSIPTRATGVTAGWVAEGSLLSELGGTFGAKTATPHELGGFTAYSKKLLTQALPDVDMLVRDDLLQSIAIEKDKAILEGSGSGAIPSGIVTEATGSVTFSGGPSWDEIVDFETQVATANADVGSMAYVGNSVVRGDLKGRVRFSSTDSVTMWRDNDTINGYPAVMTNNLSGNKVLFGNFDDVLCLDWDGIDIVADPYSAAAARQIKVTIFISTDVVVRHAGSFCVSNDIEAA